MSKPDSMKSLLDRHGYVLQLAVERTVQELARTRNSPWRVHAREVPVVVGQWATRVDIVLEGVGFRTYLACECKRTDPALAWFFARVPQFVSHQVTFDRIQLDPGAPLVQPVTFHALGAHPYHIGVVGKSGMKGDGSASGRDQIEESVTQALKGATGLLNFLYEYRDPRQQAAERFVVPAVVTTSRLFVTEADVTVGSLEDGTLPEDVDIEERSWLWYQYHSSPHLLSDYTYDDKPRTPAEATMRQFTRSVAIIRANALADFFAVW